MNGSFVKDWMQKQGLRPEELAVKLKVSLSTVNNILNNKKPYRPLITVLASIMGVPEETLLDEPKSKRQKTSGT